jgi:CheY-like chemotaxis protein
MVILYADDDGDDQEVFAEIIHFIDPTITIIPAKDGLEAMKILSDGYMPDLIFLDISMPLLNGFEVLAKIRIDEKLKNIEVVMYSTTLYESTCEKYASLNANYLHKPNTMMDGVQALMAIVSKSSSTVSFS